MKKLRIGAICAGAVSVFLAAGSAHALMIDVFDTGSLGFIGPSSTLDIETLGTMIGGERDETITNTSPGGGILAGADSGSYSYGALSAAGTALLTWDGSDASPLLDATGLGGLDFTDGGATDSFQIRFETNDFAAPVTLIVYTSALDFSSITVSSPGGIPSGPAITLFVPFADFIDSGAGADFASVGAFTLEIDGLSEPQLDMTLSFIQTTAIPEPSTIAQLALGLLGLGLLGRHSRKS